MSGPPFLFISDVVRPRSPSSGIAEAFEVGKGPTRAAQEEEASRGRRPQQGQRPELRSVVRAQSCFTLEFELRLCWPWYVATLCVSDHRHGR